MNSAGQNTVPDHHSSSVLAPFGSRHFMVLWIATVMSNVGTWMHDVSAGWLMTSLSPSPLFVALVQTATTLPIFLFALPAGALADIVNKRKLLLGVQLVMAGTALALGYVVYRGDATPAVLLLFTFMMGIGTAVAAPAWQAIVPGLVPRKILQQAVAVNSVGINISRAIGPALGGFIIGYSIALPFLINGLSFLLVVCALLWWRPIATPPRLLPAENMAGALKAGVRYALHSSPLKATLARALSFFLFASAYWALLPLIAKNLLNGDATLYGFMMGAVGVGAVSSAFILPSLRKQFGADTLVALGTVGTAMCMLVLASAYSQQLAVVSCFFAGACWIAVLTSLNVSAQVALPEWVRARGLAVFITVLFGSMSVGSLFWGQLSSLFGVANALYCAAAVLVLIIPLTWRFKLQVGESMDLSPSMHWPQPVVGVEFEQDQGPVMITLEYFVKPDDKHAFYLAAHKLKEQRYRDGAYTWGLFEDTAKPGRFIECFMVESWLEHLRQHERVTHADADIQNIVLSFHQGPKPVVEHYIAASHAKHEGKK
ncbi:MFS transporter [Rheinheimera oceanensis]|uniref:MFS transporter n=1 Tax=Rheinheimera oceanensis TaxID=2817449 RepID=UPI001BFE5A11|nr:MFS transporter [Rheinheimera oceanensis]